MGDDYQRRVLDDWHAGRIWWAVGPDLGGWCAFRAAARHADGSRVRVTARTAQAIADTMPGARLLTPAAVDVIRTHARARGYPSPRDQRNQPAAIQASDAELDRQLTAAWPDWLAGGDLAPYVCDGLKDWVLTEELSRRGPAVACNYGWFLRAGRDPAARRSVTGQHWLIQQPGYRHDPDHWDYSQCLRLAWGALPTHDGATIDRQPSSSPPAVLPPPPTATDAQASAVGAVALALAAML